MFLQRLKAGPLSLEGVWWWWGQCGGWRELSPHGGVTQEGVGRIRGTGPLRRPASGMALAVEFEVP